MGEIVSGRKLSVEAYKSMQFPIVLCNPKTIDEQAIKDSGYMRFALNPTLAERLVILPEKERLKKVREVTLSLIPKQTPVYLSDYEMLFDPRYEIDVLKLFYEIARRQKLVVKWCGELANQELVYAELGYSEYKRYQIAKYDIICVN